MSEPIQQPLVHQEHHWKHSTFGCLTHMNECLCMFCCGPCYLWGQWSQRVAEIGERPCLEICLFETFVCCYPMNRQYITHKFGIDESVAESCLWWCCCKPCAVLQESYEIQDRHHQQQHH